MAKARKHRDAELDRLRGDTRAAARLEMDDGKIPLPGSSGPFPAGKSDDIFRERWRKLVAVPEETRHGTLPVGTPATGATTPSIVVEAVDVIQQSSGYVPVYDQDDLWSNSSFEPAYHANTNRTLNSSMATDPHSQALLGQTEDPLYNALPVPLDWTGGRSIDSGIMPWVDADLSVENFPDLDVNMDLDTEVNWYNWVESAKGMNWNSGAFGDGRS